MHSGRLQHVALRVLGVALYGAALAMLLGGFLAVASREPLGTPTLVTAIVLLVATAYVQRRAERAAPSRGGRCHVCGYDLRGLPSPRCPECGASRPPAAVRPPASPP